MKEYTYPKSINDLKNDNHSREEKGKTLEEFLYQYLQREFDNVLYTPKYDKGVDLIVFNNSNKEYRIGIQAKNFISKDVYKKDIQSMNLETEKIYYLEEMRLFTTSTLNDNAVQYCRNTGIEYYEEEDIVEMIKEINGNNLESTSLDTKTELYRLRNKLMKDFGKTKPHHIMSYRTIRDILEKEPKTLDELMSVHGFGKFKVANYGPQIIQLFG